LEKYDSEKSFFAWLYTISLNLIRNHLKRKKIASFLLSNLAIQDSDSNPEFDLIKSQETSEIFNYIQRLPTDMREAIVLRYYQDLKFEEAALICGISLSAFKMRVYRALERLKTMYLEKTNLIF
jgi:RNA polymerase sigma-70 factor (ECF subfamily)